MIQDANSGDCIISRTSFTVASAFFAGFVNPGALLRRISPNYEP